tara:strand:- start:3754 stop:4158 length:405 start_codon:yes stop_codon:yes gene_type:complete
MENNVLNFESVYQYMDIVFKDKNPSKQEIKEAKKNYRIEYQKQYQEMYKKKHFQITFRITEEQYHFFKTIAAQEGLKVSKLIKIRALQKHQLNNKDIKSILFELIDDIEESIQENITLNPNQILKKLEMIEEAL